TIKGGILEIEDSKALGDSKNANTVRSGASLELAVDDLVDSVTGDTTHLLIADKLSINGPGFTNLGALYSHSGINSWITPINLVSSATSNFASIGVDPAQKPVGTPYNYDITTTGTVLDD